MPALTPHQQMILASAKQEIADAKQRPDTATLLCPRCQRPVCPQSADAKPDEGTTWWHECPVCGPVDPVAERLRRWDWKS